MPAFSIPPSLGPGSRLGPYEIIAPLRAGGMATLFLGRRIGPAGFARHVAIKVVHAHLASDPSFIEMFLDEARLAARIQHPNVVHTEELGEAKGMFYLAMEYVHGCTLSQFLLRLIQQKRGLAVDLAVHIAMKLADGLHAAHEVKDENGQPLGVVHRDVSPQNVLLAYDGHVKLIDFGVAKAAGRTRDTTGASLKGKIRYMAPEQAWGRPIDRRSDVYALGIVLWEALTHRRLFTEEDDFAALEAVRTPHIVGPRTWVPSIGDDLDHAVMTALAPDPDARYRTAQAFRRALGNACPKATRVEPDDLGALLVSVMQEDIERERRSAPPAVTRALQVKPADVVRRADAMNALTRELPAYVEADDAPTRAARPERPTASDSGEGEDESRVRLSDVSGVPRAPSRSTVVLVVTTLGVLALFAATFGTYYYEHYGSPPAPAPAASVAPATTVPSAPPSTVAPEVAPPPTRPAAPHGRVHRPPGPTTSAATPSGSAPAPLAPPPPWSASAPDPAPPVAPSDPAPPPDVDFDAPFAPGARTPPASVAPARLPPASVAPVTRSVGPAPLRRFPP